MLKAISQTIKLFISNWNLFSLIVLTFWLPGIIIYYLISYYFSEQFTALLEYPGMLILYILIYLLIYTVFSGIQLGAIAYSVYQIKQGLKVTYYQAISKGIKNWLNLFGTMLIACIYIILSSIFFIIPGIILGLCYAFIIPVVMLEGRKYSGALNRSITLTKGKKLQMLGAYILWAISITLLDYFIQWLLKLVGLSNNFLIELGLNLLSNIEILIMQMLLFVFYYQAKKTELLNQAKNY